VSGLGAGAEFDRIRAIATALGGEAGPLDDDCALVPLPTGDTLVLSTDLSIEDVHFRRAWLTAEEIGWRAAAAALSDLAAEGAEAVGLLAAVGVPAGVADDDITALMFGAGAAAASCGAAVLGGDLTRAPSWTVAVTVVGRARLPVTRRGAMSGDGLWVTGALGGARAALVAWERDAAPAPDARAAFARPSPRIAAGRWLAGHGARAMLDVSDGLAGDAGHLAAASGVEVRVDLTRVPVAAAARAEAMRLGVPPAAFAAAGGEDYELLAALPPEFSNADAAACRSETGSALTRVGVIAAGSGVRCELHGRAYSLGGYDHFG
jgi:thiamine-monophosphate kinase